MRGAVYLILLLLLFAAPARPEVSPPRIGVVDSPVAERWLARAGASYVRRAGASLGAAPIRGIRVLVLPVEAVSTTGAVSNVQEFVASGGKLVAVYWGTLAPGSGGKHRATQLTSLLGVRPAGWLDSAPGPLTITDLGVGAAPAGGKEVSLPETPVAVVEPLAGAEAVAKWSSTEAEDLPAGRAGAAFLRNGVIYLAPNLLCPRKAGPERRELLFWAIQRVAPEIGCPLQARDRIASAVAACAAAAVSLPSDASHELRTALDAAQAALADARAQLQQGRAVEATKHADRARILAEELLGDLRTGGRIER
jgi:hypothetical protein